MERERERERERLGEGLLRKGITSDREEGSYRGREVGGGSS